MVSPLSIFGYSAESLGCFSDTILLVLINRYRFRARAETSGAKLGPVRQTDAGHALNDGLTQSPLLDADRLLLN